MGRAPIGYANKSHENGKKYIALSEPEASLMKYAFEKLADGTFWTEQILKALR